MNHDVTFLGFVNMDGFGLICFCVMVDNGIDKEISLMYVQ